MRSFLDQHKGELRLLVLQPTAFCNIDCTYCYLADRSNKRRMSPYTAVRVLEHLYADGLIDSELELCWHLGEPLSVGLQFYETVVPAIAAFADGKFAVRHTFQTNGTLIDETWCAFFKRIDAVVGVSLDGPAEFHDRTRRTRSGKGTFERVVRGLRLLQQVGIQRYIIAVLGPEALREPDRIFDFFADLGESNICFNIEETEGIHISPAHRSAGSNQLARGFYRRILERIALEPERLWVRDLQKMLGLLVTSRRGKCENENNIPFRIISVAWDGAWTTFSPELISTAAPRFADFRFGNLAVEPISHTRESGPFQMALEEMRAGIERCREECQYFAVCGGGAPSNKFSELGTLNGTETHACRSTVKRLADGCMDFIESHVLQDRSADETPLR